MSTPVSDQLLKVNIKTIYGPDLSNEGFEVNLENMTEINFMDFLDEETDALNEEQMQTLSDLFSREDAKPEDLARIFRLAIPDLDNKFKTKMLAVKEELIRARIEQLADELKEPEFATKITAARQAADVGQWSQVEQIIAELNQEL
ncbi:MAG TPA: hypothetical protein VD999_02340 [Vitreimonas sp.]|nr:hypothetical protein [Vitreimonas sp.]